LASNDERCKGCSSHEENMTIHIFGGLHCGLKPDYKGKQCPCLICLVQSICMSDDEDCKEYYNFGTIQQEDGLI
jgi:hypothetical protein